MLTAAAGTIVRDATVADIPRLLVMGRRFRAETVYATRLPDNPDQMRALGERLITTPEGLLLVADQGWDLVGMIGVFLFVHHFSGLLTAGEVFFWVEPEHRGYGVRLLRRAEQWAAAHGATTMQMIAPTPEVGQLYDRLGYHALEVAYEKELACP
jgi:GNAT superfamily N-acetyltransferase